MSGVLRRLDRGMKRIQLHGFRNKGGTLDVAGMLFANRCTWAHIVASAAALLDAPVEEFLTADEIAAVEGRGDPHVVMHGPNS
jgi:phosphoketolase